MQLNRFKKIISITYYLFKNININILKGLGYVSISRFFILFLGFITSIIWANFSDPTTYGKYLLIVSFITFMDAFSMPGLSTSSQISSAKNIDGNLALLIKKKIIFSTIGSLGFLIISVYYMYFKNDLEVSYLCIIASIHFPFINLLSIWDSWLNSKKEFLKLSLIQSTIGLLNFIILVLTLIVLGEILIILFLILLLQTIVNLAILYYFLSKTNNKYIDHSIIKYGYSLSFTIALPLLIGSSERFIISELLSFKDIAIFSVSLIFPGIIVAIYGLINRVILPFITEANNIIEAYTFLKTVYLQIIILFFFISIFGYYFIEVIIETFYPKEFYESIFYAELLFIFCAISTPPTFLANILRAHRIIKFSLIFENINAPAKIILGCILISYFGLIGIVITYLIIYIFSALFFTCYFIYEYKTIKHD